MRCYLEKSILGEKEIVFFDDFTSVVNLEVAKTGSFAIQKAIRKLNKKFIAVGCHSDIIEWLQPDWIYNTDEQRFFFALESSKDPKSKYKFSELATNIKKGYGKYSGSITI